VSVRPISGQAAKREERALRGCLFKRPHRSEADALGSVPDRVRISERLHAYCCPRCDAWHLGHQT